MNNLDILKNLHLDQSQLDFLQDYQRYGFKNESQMLSAALERLQLELNSQQLEESADLYAEIYLEDEDLQNLTEAALQEWPQP